MTELLVMKNAVSSLEETSFGGVPVKNKGNDFEWPVCKTCDGPMQYLFRVATPLGLEQVFMCQNEPGLCDEWDANEGGNRVVVLKPKSLEVVKPPEHGETSRGDSYGVSVQTVDSNDYDVAREAWHDNEANTEYVLGKLKGQAFWIQGDETPNCDACNNKMQFVGQFEEGPDTDHSQSMNLGGGGVGYLFDCSTCTTAKFLFQC